MEEFWYLGMVFMSRGRLMWVIVKQTGKAFAVMRHKAV